MLRSPLALWTAFAVVHGWLILVGVFWLPADTFWDIDLYRWWMWQGLHDGVWPVLSGPWVYPAGAIVPMFAAALGGTGYGVGYSLAWSLWLTAFNAAGVVALLHAPRVAGHRHARPTLVGAWWWVAFTALLGPVAMGRLDAVVAPVVVGALVLALRHPRTASALLTAGAWVKVAPGALLLPLWLVVRRRRDVVVPAVLVSAAVVLAVALGGGLPHVLSFLTQQDERGLQIEAVGATPWVAASLWRPDIALLLNEQLITWEVDGPGAQAAADVLGALFYLGLAAAAGFLWWCSRRLGPRLWSDETARAQLLLRGALLVATLLIVLNKVGSPQYVGWIAPPVAVALALRLPGWGRTAALVAAIAAATQVVFPWGYSQITGGGAGVTLVLMVRNVALVALVVLVVRDLLRDTSPDDSPDGPPDADDATAGQPALEREPDPQPS